MIDFSAALREARAWPLKSEGIDVLQLNLGKRCNQSCVHCHVGAGPNRTEQMARSEIDTVLSVIRQTPVRMLDLTGGAPELHPDFEYIISEATALGCQVIDRCNLTVLLEPGMEHLVGFMSDHRVEVIASLPYFLEANVDRHRGTGVFRKSLEAMHLLNSAGYGFEGSGLDLSLVYNPGGAFLPGSQGALEEQFRTELGSRYGVSFSRLYTMTNMPIGRFGDFLGRSGNEERYWQKLTDSFNSRAIPSLMCRQMISVGWDGTLYDCDFNQMLGLGLSGGLPNHIRDFDYHLLALRTVETGRHCFGCTAGYGSSCGGALSE